MKLKNWIKWSKDEKPLERIPADGGYCAIFRTIGCVGDSLSSGEFEGTDEKGERTYHDMFEYSWGQFLARMTGSKVYNFSRGGMSAKEYCESFGEANDFWNPDKACEAYIVALGVNDISAIAGGDLEFGSMEDIKEDYRDNAHTFIGQYAAIIQKLKTIVPKAKFFLMTLPNDPQIRNGDGSRTPYSQRHDAFLRELVQRFDNCYLLDLATYGPVYDEEFRSRFFLNGHMNPQGYRLTAQIVESYIDYIIRHNPQDFDQVAYFLERK